MATVAPRLRVGIFAASRMQPRALVEAFARIAESTFTEIVLIATRTNPAARPPWLWRAYQQMDLWAFGRGANAGEDTDLLALVGSQQQLPIPDDDVETPAMAAWRTEVEALGLDVAFTLGEIPSEMVIGTARHGIWRLDLGGSAVTPGGLEGVREVIERHDVTTASLNARLSVDEEQRLAQSWSRTTPFSISRNRDRLLRRAAQLPARALLALYQAHVATLSNASLRALPLQLPEPEPEEPAPPRRPLDSNLEPVRSLVNVGWRMARRGLEKLFYVDQWFIAFRFSSTQSGPPALGPFACLVPPRDRFWADPFPLRCGERYFIFFEELVFAEGKAHISVIEVFRNGQYSKPIRVLERPYHVSYPFLIEADGRLFMIPESGENGSVELYACESFPDRWRLEKVLLHADYCADASFFHTGNTWWMFVNLGSNDMDVHDELHLFYADRLDGEWHAHPANPVKSDVRSARSAGRPYLRGGQLYRPAQIGVPLYGSGISINKVLELSRQKYAETEVDRIIPAPASNVLGIHTLNRAGELSVVDGFTRRQRIGGKVLQTLEPMLVSIRPTSFQSTTGDQL